MKSRAAFVAIIAAALASALEARPKVQVVFDIPVYRSVYDQTVGDAGLKQLRQLVLNSLFNIDEESKKSGALSLPQLIGFVDFVRDAADHQLRIDIADKNPGATTADREVFFRISLYVKAGDGKYRQIETEPTYWTFRSQQDFASKSNDVPAFANEIKGKLLAKLRSQSNQIVKEQLSFLSIADKAWCERELGEFILPFAVEELSVGQQTTFEISADVEDDLGSDTVDYQAKPAGRSGTPKDVPEIYHGKMKLAAVEESKTKLKEKKKVDPKGVYIIHYERPLERPKPSSRTTSGGGG